jgi:recombinational DNA repair protein RecR
MNIWYYNYEHLLNIGRNYQICVATNLCATHEYISRHVGDIHFELLRYQANLAMGEHLQYLYHITLQKILT